MLTLSLLLSCTSLSSLEPAAPGAARGPAAGEQGAHSAAQPQPEGPTMLPPHFSAQQLQAAMPVGTRLVFQTNTLDNPPQRMVWEVLSVHESGMEMRSSTGDNPPVTETHLWAELALHSSFPEGRSKVEQDQRFELALGQLSGTRYTVTDTGGEVTLYEFADELPGPPVRMVQKVAGQTRMQMVLVEHSGLPTRDAQLATPN